MMCICGANLVKFLVWASEQSFLNWKIRVFGSDVEGQNPFENMLKMDIKQKLIRTIIEFIVIFEMERLRHLSSTNKERELTALSVQPKDNRDVQKIELNTHKISTHLEGKSQTQESIPHGILPEKSTNPVVPQGLLTGTQSFKELAADSAGDSRPPAAIASNSESFSSANLRYSSFLIISQEREKGQEEREKKLHIRQRGTK
eukprot:TRINITY_DN42799_c0_g1_i2.p2 TRINITY_DN42799_c0_g1~~TRINITY_DN42799_c0_g1_i2.p2  ORF type:complete len:202 (+),score=21.94 TRINITY_DN42799_c0_g1_i2:359-964(+)